MAVERAGPDPRLPGDLLQRGVDTARGEMAHGGVKDAVAVTPCVRAQLGSVAYNVGGHRVVTASAA